MVRRSFLRSDILFSRSEGAAGSSTSRPGSCPRPSTPSATATSGPPRRSASSHGTCHVRRGAGEPGDTGEGADHRPGVAGSALHLDEPEAAGPAVPDPASGDRPQGVFGRRRRGGDLRRVRGGTAPRQPLPGTHGVWPQGVCCSPALTAADKPVRRSCGRSGQPAASAPSTWLTRPRDPGLSFPCRRAPGGTLLATQATD